MRKLIVPNNYPFNYVNRTEIQGFLGGDPVVRLIQTSKGDGVVCSLNIATNKVDGDKKYTDWHDVVIYGGLGELVAQTAHKGDFVRVLAENRQRKVPLTDKDKADGRTKPRMIREIVCNEVYVLIPAGDVPAAAEKFNEQPESKAPAPIGLASAAPGNDGYA